MSDLCRICLRSFETDLEIQNSRNMFNHYFEDLSYSEIYQLCIGHSIISDQPYLPISICEECERNLLNTISFKFQCLKTEDILANITIDKPIEYQEQYKK